MKRRKPTHPLKVRIIEMFGSQRFFAAKLGVSESFVSYVLTGKRSLTEKDRQAWSEALQTPVDQLLSETRQAVGN